MGVLKTLAYAAVAICLAVTAAQSEDSLLNRVTECVGRLSAQMEHHWLLPDATGRQVETERSHLLDVLDAIVTPETASRALSVRIEAKMAHAALLTQSAFSRDERRSAWANKRAREEIDQCRDMLLSASADTAAPALRGSSGVAETVNQGTWKASQ